MPSVGRERHGATSPIRPRRKQRIVVATCRIVFPKSWVRLSAGREGMSEGEQALCLLAGANSIFVGDRLLTTDNPGEDRDQSLLDAVGFEASDHDTMERGSVRTLIDAR